MSTLIKYKDVAAANLQPSDLGHIFSIEEEGNKLVSRLLAYGITERIVSQEPIVLEPRVTIRGVDAGFQSKIDATVTIYREVEEQMEVGN